MAILCLQIIVNFKITTGEHIHCEVNVPHTLPSGKLLWTSARLYDDSVQAIIDSLNAVWGDGWFDSDQTNAHAACLLGEDTMCREMRNMAGGFDDENFHYLEDV